MVQKTIFDNRLLSWILKKFAVLYFRVNKWEIESVFHQSTTKCVIVAAPHTTSLDLPYMLLLAYLFHLKVYWIGKEELFIFPFKKIMLWLGGLPIKRGVVGNKTIYFGNLLKSSEEQVHLVIAPSGTRKNLHVRQWNKGFYYIALHAKVPLALAYIDYKNKKAGIGNIFMPTGDYEADMQFLEDFYSKYLAVKVDSV